MSFACSICETTVELPYQNPIFRNEKPLSHSQLEGIKRLIFWNLRIWFGLLSHSWSETNGSIAQLSYSPQGADLLNTTLSINRTSAVILLISVVIKDICKSNQSWWYARGLMTWIARVISSINIHCWIEHWEHLN